LFLGKKEVLHAVDLHSARLGKQTIHQQKGGNKLLTDSSIKSIPNKNILRPANSFQKSKFFDILIPLGDQEILEQHGKTEKGKKT